MRLVCKFNAIQHHYGEFFAGFPWTIYGCGTFRLHVSSMEGERRMRMFMRLLGLATKAWIPYIAVPEGRWSGCGLPSIPLHYHFVAACPQQWVTRFAFLTMKIWGRENGNSKVDLYDPSRGAPQYIAKTAGNGSFEYFFDNLERLPYHGPKDLLLAALENRYVPNHAKGRFRLKTLRTYNVQDAPSFKRRAS